jgi:hypothetical protein
LVDTNRPAYSFVELRPAFYRTYVWGSSGSGEPSS